MKKLALVVLLASGSGAPQDPEALIQQLRAEDIAVRERAYNELEKLGPAAEAALKKVVADADANVAQLAGRLLKGVELERLFSPALKAEFPGIARRLARAGGSEWTRTYLQVWVAEPDASGKQAHSRLSRADLEPLALLALRSARTQEEKEKACAAAQAWRHRSARPALVELLRDPIAAVRVSARNALHGFLGRDVFALFLTEFPDDPFELVECLHSRSQFVPYEALSNLMTLLRNSETARRELIIDILMRIGAPDPIPDGLGYLKNEDMKTRLQGLTILKSLGNREHGAAVLPLVADPQAEVRSSAIQALGELKFEIPGETLKKLLEDENLEVRQSAMLAPRREIEPELLPALRRNLGHQNEYVRDKALRVLVRIKDPELAGRSLQELEGPPTATRSDFMWALVQVAPEKAPAALRKILERPTEDTYVRRRALEHLENLEAVPPPATLLALTKDPDKEVASAAARRLAVVAPEILRGEYARLLSDPKLVNSLQIGFLFRHARPEGLVPELMRKFRDSEEMRAGIGTALVWLDADSVVPELKEMLKDEDYDLKLAALRVLARISKSGARAEFLGLLDDADAEIQTVALGALENAGFGKEWERIAKLSEDEDKEIRQAAVRILWSHPCQDLIPTFRRLLDDPEREIMMKSAVALLELGDRELPGTMIEWLGSDAWRKLSLASEILALGFPPEHHDRILGLLERRENHQRQQGIWLMETANLAGEARRLLPFLGDGYVGEAAASTIASLEVRDLIPDLSALLKSPDVQVREQALTALTGLGDARAAPAIRELLADRDIEIRIQAVRSLGALGDRAAVPSLVALLKDPRTKLREAAVKALGWIGDPAAAPALWPIMTGPRGGLDDSVLEAIGSTRAPDAVPHLLRKLEAWDDDHTEVVEALGDIGSKEAVPALIKHFEADRCTWCLGRALGRLNAVEALPAMRKKLERLKAAGDYDERLAFRTAQLGEPSFLLELLEHPSEGTRGEAARYLCELGDRRGVPEILKQEEASSRSVATLNSARKPGLWKALRAARFRGVTSCIRRRVLERFAARMGLKVRWEGLDSIDRRAWAIETIDPETSQDSDDGGEVLTDFLDSGRRTVCREARRTIPRFTFVLEDDCIRVMPREDALKFWRNWLAEQESKQK